MADPLSITAGIIAVGGVALKSSTTLLETIRSFQSQNKDARALKAELTDLTVVLESLLATIASNPTLDFKALELPLQRCGNACQEYEKIIARCTKHSTEGSRPSVRDWITQKYLQGDINDFKAMLAAHKSTINIAIANANLRISTISPQALEDYKEMIVDTTSDLDAHLQDLQQKIDRLESGDVTAIDDVAAEWHAMLEEKKSTQQGLSMCAQLSAQVAQFETASTESTYFTDRPSAHKHVKSGLGEARGSIQSLVARLRSHEALIDSQLEAMALQDAFPESVAAQLARLQQTKESVSQCIEIVSEASMLADERSNLFEDITLAENSYAFSVSTVKELVTARRLSLRGRSRHFGGQVNDETVQMSVTALTQLDTEHIRAFQPSDQDERQGVFAQGPELPRPGGQFSSRFGPGVPLSHSKTG